jgi:hypothetical protein
MSVMFLVFHLCCISLVSYLFYSHVHIFTFISSTCFPLLWLRHSVVLHIYLLWHNHFYKNEINFSGYYSWCILFYIWDHLASPNGNLLQVWCVRDEACASYTIFLIKQHIYKVGKHDYFNLHPVHNNIYFKCELVSQVCKLY